MSALPARMAPPGQHDPMHERHARIADEMRDAGGVVGAQEFEAERAAVRRVWDETFAATGAPRV